MTRIFIWLAIFTFIWTLVATHNRQSEPVHIHKPTQQKRLVKASYLMEAGLTLDGLARSERQKKRWKTAKIMKAAKRDWHTYKLLASLPSDLPRRGK